MVEKGDIARLKTGEHKPSQASSYSNKLSYPAVFDQLPEKTDCCFPVDFKPLVCAFVLWKLPVVLSLV